MRPRLWRVTYRETEEGAHGRVDDAVEEAVAPLLSYSLHVLLVRGAQRTPHVGGGDGGKTIRFKKFHPLCGRDEESPRWRTTMKRKKRS